MASPSASKYELLDRLATEFAARYRRGERPPLQEYIDRYPELADDIRELFPTMVEIEQVKEDRHEAIPRPPVAAPTSPQQVGDYRILREVGRGGMGVVYEAEQVSLGRRVALKVLSLQVPKDRTALERFHREARSAARLHHTNIVPVFEVGEDGAVCYYAMQFIQGQGLDQVIDELCRLRADSVASQGRQPAEPPPGVDAPGSPDLSIVARSLLTGRFQPPGPADATTPEAPVSPRPEPTTVRAAGLSSSAVLPGQTDLSGLQSDCRHYFRSVARVGEQAAQALAHAHARGIVHRDVKPSNLLLDGAGIVWITDFGLAKTEEDSLTRTGDVVGTVRYMAPERFRGEGDARADVYGLGLTLYELLVLRPAFDAPDRLRLIDDVKNREPPRPRALDRRIPRDLETIVLKATDKDPRRRYQSAADLAEDLRRFLGDEPIRARRSRAWEHVAKWAKRHPAAAALVGVSGLAALALVALAMAQWYNDRLRTALDDATAQRAEADRQRGRIAEIERNVRYLRDLQLAEQAWQDAHVGHTLRVLDRWGPAQGEQDLRGWEWYYLRGLCHKEFRTLRGPEVLSNVVAFHPDGRQLAVGDWGNKVHVWDVLDGRKLHTLTGHQGGVTEVAFSPDGRHLASASHDHTVRIWDTASGQETGRLPGNDSIWSVAFSPDGRLLAAAGENGWMALWDFAARRELRRFRGHQAHIACVAFSPDGRHLASAAQDRTAKLWDAAGGPALRTFAGHTQQVSSVAFSPDGQTLATSSEDGTIKLWDPATGRERAALAGHTAWVVRVAFSPDGRFLASSSNDMTVRLWDVARGQQAHVLRGHEGANLRGVAFSPDGRLLASANSPGTVKIWDLASGPQEYRFLHQSNQPVRALAFASDGRRLAAAGFNQPMCLWDVPTGRRLRLFSGHAGWVECVTFRADGKLLASGGTDGTVRLWDPESGQAVRTLAGHAGWVNGLSFSPDGRLLASASADQTLIVWDVATGQKEQTLRGQEGGDDKARAGFSSAAFSPDGHLLASGGGDKVQIWETQTWQMLRTFPAHPRGVATLAFSPDGTRLASGGFEANEGQLKLWDVASGEVLREFQGHWSTVYSVAFSPDGRRLASAGDDRMVKVWDTESGQVLLSLKEHGHRFYILVYAVAFSPDGRWLASGDAGGEIRLWDAPPDGDTEADDRASLLAPDRTLAWHLTEAEDSLEAGQGAAALWHVHRLGDVPLTDPLLYARMAGIRAEFGLWDEAAADYGKAIQCGVMPLEDWKRYALVCLRVGDQAGYRQVCETLLKRVRKSPSTRGAANNVAWICSLGPDAVGDYAQPLALAKAAVASLPPDAKEERHFVLDTLGAVLCRAGRYQDAIDRLNEGIAASSGEGVGQDWVFLAIAHHRLGHAAEARKWLARVPAANSQAGDRLSWDALEVELLRREAEALLKPAGS
jgi:WD40 repeat protein/serine/threonine protein kinase